MGSSGGTLAPMEPHEVFGSTRRRASALATRVILSSALLLAAVGCGAADSAGGEDEETTVVLSLEERCSATCQKMEAFAFPKELCKDANADDHDAYFCQSIYWSPCLDSCVAAVVEAPNDTCRTSWEPLMTCIAESDGYISLLFSQPSFGKCRPHINKVGNACWGHALD